MIFGRRRAPQQPEQTPQPGPPAPEDTGRTPHPSPETDEPRDPAPCDPAPRDARPAGLRVTEGLLPIFGPAQVGDSTAPLRPASEAERSRDRALRTTLTRVVGGDGRSYVVAVPDAPPGTTPGSGQTPRSSPG